MLSAQKQEMPSDTPPANSPPPTGSGFSKVLNSIQGLQQRLDDFSVEEVSRAHAEAQALIRELGDLQAQLNALAKLKDAGASADAQIAAVPEDNFDLVGPDNLEKHPQLRAIVQAGKLIRMHRMLRAAQASADLISFNVDTSERSINPKSDTRSGATIASTASTNPPPENSPATDYSAESWIGNNIDASTLQKEIAVTPASETRSSAINNPPAAQDSKTAPAYEFADLKLEEAHETAPLPKQDFLQAEKPHQKPSTVRKNKKRSGKAQIDQRLLNELIETYGEFAGAASSRNRSETVEMPPASSAETTTSSTDLVPIEPRPADPAFVQSTPSALLTLPSPAREMAEPAVKDILPSAKSRGEIDRQLKNIIKDYGEYDLYSHRKSINIKTVAMAAFALLGLILGGLYFFKAPPTPVPAAIEATMPAAQNGAGQAPGATRALKQRN